MNERIARRIASLTEEQQRVLRLVAGGATTTDLAVHLGVSRWAARRAVQAMLVRLGARTTAEAALLWWGSRAGTRGDLLVAAQALVA